MALPPMAWVILALGVIWLGLRLLSRKAEEKRAEARELRMAELMAERDRLLGNTTEEAAPKKPVSTEKKTCLGCKTVNAPDATTCTGCGLEL